MITVVGSVNQDLFLYPSLLPRIGETVISERVEYKLGGKGVNSAIAASLATKNHVTFVGGVGDDPSAEFIRNELKKYNNLIPRLSDVHNCVSGRAFITVDDKGENQIVIVPGANFAAFRDVDSISIDSECEYLMTNFEIPEQFILDLFTKFSDKKIKKFLNFSPIPKNSEILSKILELTNYLVLNEVEADHVGDRVSHIENVIITKGSRGAVWYKFGQEFCSCEAPKITPISTVGAGDCFIGTLVASLSNSLSEQDSLIRAVKAASNSCLYHGAADSYKLLND